MLFAGLLTIPMCPQRSGQKSWSARRRGRIVSSHTGSARHRRLLQKRSRSATRPGLGEKKTLPIPAPGEPSRSGQGGVGSKATNYFSPRFAPRGRGWREEPRRGGGGGYKFNFPASWKGREREPRVGEEEAEEKGVGAGQGPEPGRGGAGA